MVERFARSDMAAPRKAFTATCCGFIAVQGLEAQDTTTRPPAMETTSGTPAQRDEWRAEPVGSRGFRPTYLNEMAAHSQP